MDEDVVTETSFPDWRGLKADRRGSRLCRIACTWKSFQQTAFGQYDGAVYLGLFGYDAWCSF